MRDILNVIERSLLSLVILFFVTKIIGKKQVSQLSLFDYVIGISIGNFAAEMAINLDSKEIHGIVAVVVFGLVAYLVSILTMKSIYLRRFFMGCPTIIIEKGKIIEEGLRKVKFDINDMLEQCRIKGYFDVKDIEYAIVEANGELSILPKNRLVNITDLKLNVNKEGLCANVIIDGKIMINNLNNINKSKKWLIKELRKENININDVILATVDINDNINFYKKNKNSNVLNILE